jgi:hypothetical protein
MPERSLGSQLGQLALALLNATLLLAALLVFGLWLLLGRAQDFAAETAGAAAEAIGDAAGGQIADRVATLDDTLTKLATLDNRVSEAVSRAGTANGPAVAELGALRSDVQALTASVGHLTEAATGLRDQPAKAASAVLYQIFQSFAARLAPVASPDVPT